MKQFKTNLHILLFTSAFALFSGCSGGSSGPELGRTTGKITINGEPAPAGLTVYFESPQSPTAIGVTDADGVYVLSAPGGRQGAPLGTNTVRIVGRIADLPENSLAEVAADQGTTVEALKAMPVIPARYNDQSELTAEVAPGRNEFNFNLEVKK